MDDFQKIDMFFHFLFLQPVSVQFFQICRFHTFTPLFIPVTPSLDKKLPPPVHKVERNQSVRAWHRNWRERSISWNKCDWRSSYQLTVRAQHCSSHRRRRLPHFPSLLLLVSRNGKAFSLQPLWAGSQPAAMAPIHNCRIEGSPKLKALLSLRLVATERWSGRLISLCCLG